MDVREKLVEIERAAEWFEKRAENTPMPMARKMFELAGEALREKANGVTVQEWISVKDRLPEVGQMVLGILEEPNSRMNYPYSESILILVYTETNYITGKKREFERAFGGETVKYKPTHWMPLPEPPKGE